MSVRVRRTVWPLVDTRGLTAFGSHVLHAGKPIPATGYNDGGNLPVSEGSDRKLNLLPSLTLRVTSLLTRCSTAGRNRSLRCALSERLNTSTLREQVRCLTWPNSGVVDGGNRTRHTERNCYCVFQKAGIRRTTIAKSSSRPSSIRKVSRTFPASVK